MGVVAVTLLSGEEVPSPTPLDVLVTLDYPDGVTGGLRRSTDVARSILERTRGDLTNAVVQARLQAALEAHRRDVLEP